MLADSSQEQHPDQPWLARVTDRADGCPLAANPWRRQLFGDSLTNGAGG